MPETSIVEAKPIQASSRQGFSIVSLLSFGALESIARGLNWITLALLPLVLPIGEYGIVGLMVAIEALLSTIVLCGQDRSILRYAGTDKTVIGPSLRIPAIIGSAVISLMFGMRIMADDILSIDTTVQLPLLGIAIGLSVANRLMVAIARSSNNIVLFVRHRVLVSLIKSASVFGLAVGLGTATSYVIAGCIAGGIAIVLALIKSRPQYSLTDAKKDTISKLWKFGWPFLFHTINGNILAAADRFMIEYYHGATLVGEYTLAYSVGYALLFVYGSISIYLEPRIYGYKKKADREKMLGHYTLVSTIGAVCVGVLCIVGFKFYSEFFLDASYSDAMSVVPIVIGGYLLFPIYTSANYRLGAISRTSFIAISSGIAAVANILINIALIPRYGSIGAAYATLVSYVILSALILVASILVSETEFRDLRHKNVLLVSLALSICFAVLNTVTSIVVVSTFAICVLVVVYRIDFKQYRFLATSAIKSIKGKDRER